MPSLYGIGLGVAGIAYFIKDFVKNDLARPVFAFALTIGIPVSYGFRSWDDHDRSKRYFSVDSAKTY